MLPSSKQLQMISMINVTAPLLNVKQKKLATNVDKKTENPPSCDRFFCNEWWVD
jgi:hypothetical protein